MANAEIPTKPYLLRALYEWCVDNGYTAHLAVKVDSRSQVPSEYVRNGEITLNVAPSAVHKLQMGNELIEFSARFAGAAVAILGGYLLFWFAFNVNAPRLSRVGLNVDISYGVYLYAWPVQKLLIWSNPAISPWLVFGEATTIASIIAFGSWWMVEKPFLDLKRRLTSVVRGSDVPRLSS